MMIDILLQRSFLEFLAGIIILIIGALIFSRGKGYSNADLRRMLANGLFMYGDRTGETLWDPKDSPLYKKVSGPNVYIKSTKLILIGILAMLTGLIIIIHAVLLMFGL